MPCTFLFSEQARCAKKLHIELQIWSKSKSGTWRLTLNQTTQASMVVSAEHSTRPTIAHDQSTWFYTLFKISGIPHGRHHPFFLLRFYCPTIQSWRSFHVDLGHSLSLSPWVLAQAKFTCPAIVLSTKISGMRASDGKLLVLQRVCRPPQAVSSIVIGLGHDQAQHPDRQQL